jgi:flagellar protein FlgJ
MSSTSLPSALTGAAAAAPATGGIAAASPKPTPDQITQAAQKFESMLVRQMLAESRKTNFGNTLLTNEGTKTFREMQDSRFADTVAQKGTLGFAKMIAEQLNQQAHLAPNKEPK